MGYHGDARSKAEIGRSIMKTISDLSKIRSEETPAVLTPEPSLAVEPTQEVLSARKPARDCTVISCNVEMSGALVSPDDIEIFGRVDGNIRAASVTVSATGVVRGDIVADAVFVYGVVEGCIYGATVRLADDANVRGDIFHGGLGIDSNATFEGASRRVANVMAEAPTFMAVSKAA